MTADGPRTPNDVRPSTLLATLRRVVDPLNAPEAPPPPGRRPAAVLLLADPVDASLHFIVRSDRVSEHRGQIAFPGGGAEAADTWIGDTALRETAEEMGIAGDDVELIGRLPSLLTAVSNRWLTPLVGILRRPAVVVADPFEVAEWFRVPLAALLTAPHRIEAVAYEGGERLVHCYDVDGRVIWGVTGAIVQELLERLGRRD